MIPQLQCDEIYKQYNQFQLVLYERFVRQHLKNYKYIA